MVWVLILIAVQADTFYFKALNMYPRMDDCLGARAELVEKLGRPIVNYEALCILTDQVKGTM
jgi:hypothetical protein